MFRPTSETDHDQMSEGGTRILFQLGPFEFHDTMDGEDILHRFVLERRADEEQPGIYEADQPTMYECMARFLAGEYEKREYDLERSPAHEALLDFLELATARARSGETEIGFDDLEPGDDYEGFDGKEP
jgi:hypothetical protein